MKKLWVSIAVAVGMLCAFTADLRAQAQSEPSDPPPIAPESLFAPSPEFSGRPSFRTNVGDGIGYRNGYLGLGFLYPLRQASNDFLTFTDARFLSTFDGRLGGNLGFGHRFYSPRFNRTFGAYLFGDVRNTEFATLGQISGGFESLGSLYDLRANYYIPTGTTVGTAPLFTPLGAPFLQGHNIWAFGNRQFDQALTGFDVTASFVQPVIRNLRAYCGTYYFTGPQSRDALGGRFGLNYQVTDYLNLDTRVQTDHLYGTNGLFTATFSWPGGRRSPRSTDVNVSQRLTESVERQEIIVADQQTRQGNYAFTDPRNGEPINIMYVDASAASGGSGTFEKPFHDFNEAQAALQAYDLVFVRDGIYANAVSLPDNARLWGDGTAHLLATQEAGSFPFLINTPGAQPTIFGIGGPAISLGDGNEVSGMYVNGNSVAGSQGIFSDNGDDFNVNNNFISNTVAEAMRFHNVKGNAEVVNNTITNSQDDAIRFDTNHTDALNAVVQGNTLTGIGSNGVRFVTDDASVVNAVVRGNSIGTGSDNGVQIEHNSTATSTYTIDGNTLSKTSGGDAKATVNALVTAGTVTALVENNAFNPGDKDIEALSITTSGSAVGLITATNNTVTGTYNNGFQLVSNDQSAITATFINNRFSGKYDNGYNLTSNGVSNLSVALSSNNTFTNATQNGIFATQTGTGTLNFLSNADVVSTTGGNAGIFFNPLGDAGSTFNATVQNDVFTIRNVATNAFMLTAGGNATANVNLLNNSVNAANVAAPTFNNGFQITTNGNAVVQTSINGNTIGNATLGAAGNGILITTNDSSSLTVFAQDNDIRGSSVDGIRARATGSSFFDAHFINNPNVVGNSIFDFDFNTNGAGTLLTLEAFNNSAGGNMIFTNTLGTFNISTNPITDNPGATVFVGPGVSYPP